MQKDTIAPAPKVWLSARAQSPQGKINGTYQLFPVDVTTEIGREDRFNLHDLLFYPESQMSGIRSYDSIALDEANGLLSVKVSGSGTKQIVAALQAEKDYMRNDESLQLTHKSNGSGRKRPHQLRLQSLTLSKCWPSLLIRFQEKFSRTELLFLKENRDIDPWLRFAPKQN